jgi:hypothetical protein
MLGVNTRYSHCRPREVSGDDDFSVNLNNEILWSAAEKMGFKPEKIPRNVKGKYYLDALRICVIIIDLFTFYS